VRDLEVPPAQAVGVPAGAVTWVTASADESKVLARSENCLYLWDSASGRLSAQISTAGATAPGPDRHLGEGPGLPRHSFPAISPDGSRLCIFNYASELRVYDITAPPGRLLAGRRVVLNFPSNVSLDVASYFLRFSPDAKHVLLVGNATISAGDAETLRPNLDLKPKYCLPRDVVFVHGGDQLLVTSHGYGFGKRGVHLYDLATGQLLRQWPTEFFQELATTAVSSDGRRAFVAASDSGGNRGVVLDPNAPGDTVAVVPGGNWSTNATFFPDNRRLVASEQWPGYYPGYYYGTGIIDAATRRHVATLYPTAQVCQVIVSGDGTHVGLVLRNGTMDLYRHVGRDSALGWRRRSSQSWQQVSRC
jgi:DNA-binding beta-propeller fold protein YncE